ncbi:nuclear transport factor 2 family protein [Acuticoccus sp. I52.16.1]|uniref:nuclear transport factor 2 family protein n=1 Tax=Acuticoccus sp. I52.16.1 TaxID=2928472 RepID=UPI001FD2A9A7|nr:nuclear transport factor 2 family protein [Acuticoccus sp. I52.16.1]UOM36538.1 nuclear transport factor 2 family protein [Acuticoccus sp. I52.16.1]
MTLPPPIRTYFDADGTPDGAAPMSAFARDAAVHDEGRTHSGSKAIETWWRSAKAETRHTAVPTAVTERGDVTEVRATVSGDFPGSPAELTFVFRVDDGRIVDLRIGA